MTLTQANLIEEVAWHLGYTGYSSPVKFYNNERGTKVPSGRPTIWSGKIGLIYPSDIGYATNNSACINYTLYYSEIVEDFAWQNETTCYTNDWLFYTESTGTSNGTSTTQWTISPSSSSYSEVSSTRGGSTIKSFIARTSKSVRPSFYLKSTVKITGGDGSYDNPYIFE